MPGFRPTSVRIHADAEPAYRRVEAAAARGAKMESSLWRNFQHAVERVKVDGQWGEVVPDIPTFFIERYGVRNLYCVDLSSFHRAFYTIERRDVVFLDLMDHANYDRLFGRRGRR